jgi:bifunctional pyridoxal-dependent enzyme with beta-cystathionase and maltose regulon repressor activities
MADEVHGRNATCSMYKEGNTFKYDLEELKRAFEDEHPKIQQQASPNNPTGNVLAAEELTHIIPFIPPAAIVLIDESYASYVTTPHRNPQKSPSLVKALILAAGTASRLRPLTENTPNCILKIGNKTLLQRTTEALSANGIRDLTLVTGYQHEEIEHFISATYPSLRLTYI